MPVDKFGHTTTDVKQNVATSGVSITQANNVFLKRDGTNYMTADLNMNGNSIKGLPDAVINDDEAVSLAQVNTLLSYAVRSNTTTTPTADNHIANKKYVDESVERLEGDTLANPTMTSNETIINGQTYVASASGYLVGNNNREYHPWLAFQNTSSVGWFANSLDNGWIQLKYPIPMSMSGFYIIANDEGLADVYSKITSWKVQASNDGNIFSDIVLPNTTNFDNGVLNKFTFPASEKYAYWRYYILSSTGASISTGVEMLQWIPTHPHRFHVRKCNVGYVPRLTSNANYCGFEVAASSEATGKKAFNAFKGDQGAAWVPSDIRSNVWLEIKCPTPVRIWKIGLKFKSNENIQIRATNERVSSWNLIASVDRSSWVKLHQLPSVHITKDNYFELLIDSVIKFNVYRVACARSANARSGINTMQLFVYDED